MKRGGSFVLNKRGQVTVFIIAAILIIGLAVLIYFFRPGISSTTDFDEGNPTRFLQTCVEDEIESAVETVSLQGGSMNPEFFILYQSNKVEYLCYTNEDYKTCVVQQPMLKRHIETEVENEIKDDIANCFNELKTNYEERAYDVTMQTGAVSVELLPKRVVVSANYSLTATKTDTERHGPFNVILNNNLYELVSIANSIIDFESEYGDADPGFYMSIYPDLKVEKLNQQDGSTIYVITDRNMGNKFQFASRSVAWPPGLGVGGVATN